MQNEVVITLNNISKQIGSKVIFSGLNFGIHAQDKIGVVGVNGCGKTTLLRLLTGLTDPSTGEIILRKGIKVGYLMQDIPLDEEQRLLEYIMPEQAVAAENDEEHRYKAILSTLGIDEYEKPLRLLSGGQRRKADLARVLVQEPDVLILDEPTNHLDLDTIEWLQDYLAEAKKTVIFVTHDRYFLDAVCNRILELDHGQCYLYEGNYTEYVRGKMIRATDSQRKETRRLAQLKKEMDWLNRGARARATKPKNHVDRVKELLSKSYLISNQDLDISFQTDRLGKTILELHRLGKSYGSNVLFKDIDHNFQALERIGIIGANGCGKTTLLKMIVGEVEPDQGKIKVGVNTHFAYYRQEDESFDPTLSVYDYIAQYAEVIKTRDGSKVSAAEMLRRFLFDGKMQTQKLGSLSGGERKRLYLLKSLMFGANFIVLDEPTNDLDIRTLEILEDYLDAFSGCLLVVSHDRFFLDRTVDYLFIFEGTSIRKFPGNYSDYLLVKKYQKEEAEEKERSATAARPRRIQKGLNYNEQREFERLGLEIAALEEKIQELETGLSSQNSSLNHLDYLKISRELEELQKDHDIKLQRWIELSDKADG
ncbi:MAG TPA: ABC-F family ATP-binding cassette domain-containing protein [Candidatus Cloacimonadota bacterium]|jgi:ATP-binding cassette subfamily F protein uup|nr:ABC-F family ATP-binding cassette domain-containing protein [Candidatus Cloacimonadota bacterium]HOF59209.1 ABC-F family ATP-binding cassette domain-containing protein [Candidatus Cloacimonadota bacterium]HOR58472.1 ABC-F family ATP-binding cassette domain-containing protein [Candidatus Cloacimonadota bacterium]HPB08495.1 ABC-F family ATP-binding cassette domain-containing protein [Candidatus Cloacimonadota bacterium]HQO43968.1 ABC-F family ATP-binding cassette domain-containing protein [Can